MTRSFTTKELLETKDSFLIVELDYSTKFILKHSQGIKLLESLNGAEIYKDPYNAIHTIEPNSSSYPKVTVLSQEKYLEFKMNALLKVDTNTNN